MSGAPYPNHLRGALVQGQFVMTVEVTTPAATHPLDAALAPILALAGEIREDPRVAAIALTDRSSADRDHDPIATGHRVAEMCGKAPLIHWAGKDRSTADLETDLRRAASLGLDNLLLVTGDKVRRPPLDRPVRYLDSVNALHTVRQVAPTTLLAAAVCPFKYREEELLGQYLKAAKKLRAGADLLITQIGWDMPKFAELRWFLTGRGYDVPLLAELLYLTAARGRRIRRLGLPGVTITDDFLRLLVEEEEAPDRGRASAYRRLALQIVGVRHLGYAGAQISGLHTYAAVARLLDAVEQCAQACPTLDAWQGAWQEHLTAADGRTVRVAPADGFYLTGGTPTEGPAAASAGEYATFKTMELIHRAGFQEGAVGARVFGPLLRRLDGRTGLGGLLLQAERVIKEPLVGCATCGFCRLPETAYVCPETCPKGLANGPCGGTQDNRCEFGDRECIHNRIYRISKKAGTLSNLEEVLIPPVPDAAWDSCSWVTHFRGEGPEAVRLTTPTKGRAAPP
ncbi:MAG: methylenetetrahydrofolate reductase C-terminal domain-containing protein [Armatimonadetes bacterium]|nr:methylenetetrahydrofolate reductase C-terminal domain-containing protein [Armatimonadota bacterium]